MKPRRVYFVRPIGMEGPIKIGCSQSPDRRLSALATWSPFPLEIIASIEGDEKLERRFHAKFTADHQSREWFRWSPELAETITAIIVGTFDIDTLPAPRRLHHGYKTGPAKGIKWSEERKARARIHRAVAKAEKLSGLVRDWPDVSVHDFIADPFKFGVTREERDRRDAERQKQWLAKRDATVAAARGSPTPTEPSQAAA